LKQENKAALELIKHEKLLHDSRITSLTKLTALPEGSKKSTKKTHRIPVQTDAWYLVINTNYGSINGIYKRPRWRIHCMCRHNKQSSQTQSTADRKGDRASYLKQTIVGVDET
jgi:hypothetical protein